MKKFWTEFKAFAIKGNMMTMAVGIIIGAAFTAIVTSLVNDVIMPLISLVLGKVNVSGLSFTVGDTVIPYGNFLQAVLTFILTSLVVFIIIKFLNRIYELGRKPKEKKADEPPKPTSEELLTEIRDLLKKD